MKAAEQKLKTSTMARLMQSDLAKVKPVACVEVEGNKLKQEQEKYNISKLVI